MSSLPAFSFDEYENYELNNNLGLDTDFSSPRELQNKPRKADQKPEETKQAFRMDFNEFYQERITRFEKERHFFQFYIDMITPKKNDQHNLVWYNRKLIEEARLSDLEADEIRDQIEAVNKEIDKVKVEIELQEGKNKSVKGQIFKLQEIGRAVEHDVTYVVPDRFSQTVLNEAGSLGAMAKITTNTMGSKITKVERPGVGSKGKGTQDAHSPVPQPSAKFAASSAAQTAAINSQNKFLKQIKTGEVIQLETRLHEETMRATSYLQDLQVKIERVHDERSLFKKTYHTASEEDMKEAYRLWEEVDKYEFQCFHAVAELLRLRYRILVAQREEVEELELLQLDKDSFIQREEALKQQLLDEMNQTKRRMRIELDESTKEFQKQISAYEIKIQFYKQKISTLQEATSHISQREESLQQLLEDKKNKYNKLKNRNDLEIEGFQNESKILRKRLMKLEKLAQQKQKVKSQSK